MGGWHGEAAKGIQTPTQTKEGQNREVGGGGAEPSPAEDRSGRAVLQGHWLQTGDVSDALGHALPKEQLGAHFQVLGMLDEPETHHCLLPCAELLLERKSRGTS